MDNTKITVLYLSYDGMTDSLGQSQVLPYLAGLSNQYKFHIISFEKPDRFALYEQEIRSICKQNNIDWFPLSYTKNPPIFSTLFDIKRMNSLAVKLDKKHHFKVVHCRSYVSSFVGLRLKRRHDKKFIFDMRGFWADEMIDGGIWNLKNPVYNMIYRYFKRKEKRFFIESDAIVSLTENGKAEILSWNLPNVYKEKITVNPCCVKLDLFDYSTIDSQKQSQLREKLNIHKEDYVLGYVGSVGTWYMLPEMLDFFKILRVKNPKAKFLFVTGESPSSILELCDKKGIDRKDIVIDKCLHSEVPTYISLFDTSIFFIIQAYSKKASSPTKQGELMAMGVPVVCNSGVGDTDFVVNKFGSGIVLDEFNDESYTKGVDWLTHTSFNPSAIRAGAKAFFSLEGGVSNYKEVYHSVLKTKKKQ